MEFLHRSIHDYIPEASNYHAGSRVIVNQHHSQNHWYTLAVTLSKADICCQRHFCSAFDLAADSYIICHTSPSLHHKRCYARTKDCQDVVRFLLWMS